MRRATGEFPERCGNLSDRSAAGREPPTAQFHPAAGAVEVPGVGAGKVSVGAVAAVVAVL